MNHHSWNHILSNNDAPAVVIVCVPSVIECESKTEGQKIQAGLSGVAEVYTVNCRSDPGICAEMKFDHPAAFWIPGRTGNQHGHNARREPTEFYPGTDPDGFVQEWADVYASQTLVERAIDLLEFPLELPTADYTAGISGRTDVLGDSVGDRLSQYTTGDENTLTWNSISVAAACEHNSEGIERDGHMEAVGSLESCKAECAARVNCRAIDYYSQTGWCNFYPEPCKNPTRAAMGSSSHVLVRGTGVVGWLVLFRDAARSKQIPEMAVLDSAFKRLPTLESVGIKKFVVRCDTNPQLCDNAGIPKSPTIRLYKAIGHEDFHGQEKPSAISVCFKIFSLPNLPRVSSPAYIKLVSFSSDRLVGACYAAIDGGAFCLTVGGFPTRSGFVSRQRPRW